MVSLFGQRGGQRRLQRKKCTNNGPSVTSSLHVFNHHCCIPIFYPLCRLALAQAFICWMHSLAQVIPCAGRWLRRRCDPSLAQGTPCAGTLSVIIHLCFFFFNCGKPFFFCFLFLQLFNHPTSVLQLFNLLLRLFCLGFPSANLVEAGGMWLMMMMALPSA